MNLHRNFFAAAILVFAAGIFPVTAQPSNGIVTAPVYVPDTTHEDDPLPEGVIAWDDTFKATNAAADQDFAEFEFNFTNIATVADITLVTNVTVTATNITAITNSITPVPITILNVQPGCHCTTVDLPNLPWTIKPGGSGSFKINVDLNIAGHEGTVFKKVTVMTDKGIKDLMVRIDSLPPEPIKMTDEQKMAGITASKVDRQAVFKNDCATCHADKGEGKYGKALYDADCAICHEADPRASVVPDLHNLKVPTSNEFWRTWIAHGRAGSLMPAFSSADGGPLTDLQVAELAAYLDTVIPSRVQLTNNIPPTK